MKRNYAIACSALLFATMPCYALIEQITRWINISGQEVNVLHDCHFDTIDYITTDTQHAIICTRNSFKIVEDKRRSCLHGDMIDKYFLQKLRCDNLFIKKITPMDSTDPKAYLPRDYEQAYQGSVLCGLSNLPQTYNAEFRFSLIGENYESKIREEILTTLNEIARYDDGETLNQYYQSIIKQKQVIDSTERLCAEGDNLNYNIKYIFLDCLDARILHALYSNPHQSVIDIIAGGNHCQYIENMMSSLGYIKVKTIGSISEPIDYNEKLLAPVTVIDIEESLKKPVPPLSFYKKCYLRIAPFLKSISRKMQLIMHP